MSTIVDAVTALRDNPETLHKIESSMFGSCEGACESRELTRDEWPAHYLDESLYGGYDKIGQVFGCPKCKQVIRTVRARDM